MKGFHARVVVLAVLGCTALSSGCLPLPPAETAAICNTAPSGPPTADDLAVLERLADRDLPVAIGSPPSVRLDAHDTATATALRAEFGASIDIEIGSKRLGRVPGNPDGCLLVAPTWAIAEPAPKGVTMTATPTQPVFDRNGSIRATVRVTNRTGRSIVVSQAVPRTPSRNCGDLGVALSSTTSALAVNRVDGLQPLDPNFQLVRTGRSYGRLSRMGDGSFSTVIVTSICAIPIVTGITVRPGGSAMIPITAGTESVQPGADPIVLPGTYHLRATVDVRLSTAPDAVAHRVAAPPTRVELRD